LDSNLKIKSYVTISMQENIAVATHWGGRVGFHSGNVQELLDDVLVTHDYCNVLNAV
jgi:hypothetical protein